jgi:hypothetical protein
MFNRRRTDIVPLHLEPLQRLPEFGMVRHAPEGRGMVLVAMFSYNRLRNKHQ